MTGAAWNDTRTFTIMRRTIAFRRAHPVLSKEQSYIDADFDWFDPDLEIPNWAVRGAKRFACLIHEGEGGALYLTSNASAGPAPFRLPRTPNGVQWRPVVDSGHESPEDGFPRGRRANYRFDASLRIDAPIERCPRAAKKTRSCAKINEHPHLQSSQPARGFRDRSILSSPNHD